MSRFIDISMPLDGATVPWPGSPGARVDCLKRLEEGDPANVTSLTLDVHTGTHIDAPAHMLPGGGTMDDYSLERGIGEAVVADTGGAPDIDAEILESLGIEPDCRRLLLRTANGGRPDLQREFAPDYTALTLSGAEWIVKRGIELVGIDYISIQRFQDPTDTHLVLFRAGVVIVEGLRLETVDPGRYELICLPVRLAGREAAPARVVLQATDA